MNQIVRLVDRKSYDDLLQMLRNAIATSPKSPRYAQARALIPHIERRILDHIGDLPTGWGMYKEPRPDDSPIRELGHNATNGGPDAETRHRIIDYFMEAPTLPLIQSKSYMQEWGVKPGRRRYQKLERYFVNLIAASEGRPSLRRALSKWKEDLEYIRTNWFDGKRRLNGV